jgi:hypothetical protein
MGPYVMRLPSGRELQADSCRSLIRNPKWARNTIIQMQDQYDEAVIWTAEILERFAERYPN